MASQDFSRLFGDNESQPIALSDAEYKQGWTGIVNQEPPSKRQFTAIHREIDAKAIEAYYRSRLVYRDWINYKVKDHAYGSDGVLYECISDCINVNPNPSNTANWTVSTLGGNGTGVGSQLDALGKGALIVSAQPIAPTGTLPCIGQALSKTTYADLFAAIGGLYDNQLAGNPPPAGQFRLPFFHDVHIAGSGGEGALGQMLAENPGQHSHAIPRVDAGNLPNQFSFNTAGSGGGVDVNPGNFSQMLGDHTTSGQRVNTDVADGAGAKLRPTTLHLAFFMVY